MSQRFQKLPMPTVEEQPTCDLCGEEFDDSTWEYERIYDMDLLHIICRRCASESDPELLPDDDPEKLIPEPVAMSQSVDLSPEERAKIVAERADVKYGPFASLHEAYGVLCEEIDELHDAEEKGAIAVYGDYIESLEMMLGSIRSNEASGVAEDAARIRSDVWSRVCKLQDELAECIDVIAVCDRIIAQWGEPS